MEAVNQLQDNSAAKSLRRAIFFSLCFIFGLVGGVWVLDRLGLESGITKASWLRVEEMQIETEWPLTSDKIRTWIPSAIGKNILLVSGSSLIRLLESKPWVEEVTVKKEFPSRLFINVKTKIPKALAIMRGKLHFIDDKGRWIDVAEASILKGLDLPTISWQKEEDWSTWKLQDVLPVLASLQTELGKSREVSQVVLGHFPGLKIFLSSPHIEVLMTFDQWENQMKRLLSILENPPSDTIPIRRINLTLPKKAVVSSSLSN